MSVAVAQPESETGQHPRIGTTGMKGRRNGRGWSGLVSRRIITPRPHENKGEEGSDIVCRRRPDGSMRQGGDGDAGRIVPGREFQNEDGLRQHGPSSRSRDIAKNTGFV